MDQGAGEVDAGSAVDGQADAGVDGSGGAMADAVAAADATADAKLAADTVWFLDDADPPDAAAPGELEPAGEGPGDAGGSAADAATSGAGSDLDTGPAVATNLQPKQGDGGCGAGPTGVGGAAWVVGLAAAAVARRRRYWQFECH